LKSFYIFFFSFPQKSVDRKASLVRSESRGLSADTLFRLSIIEKEKKSARKSIIKKCGRNRSECKDVTIRALRASS